MCISFSLSTHQETFELQETNFPVFTEELTDGFMAPLLDKQSQRNVYSEQ